MSEDSPFPWPTLRLGSLASEMCLGKMLDKQKNRGTLQPYLRNVNVRWFTFDLSDLKEMRFEEEEQGRFELRPGDLVICEGGEPGRAAVWRGQMQNAKIQKALHRVRFNHNEYVPAFGMYFLYYGTLTNSLAPHYTGTTIKHLTGAGLAQVEFPIPPLAEQQRIVAKIEEIFSALDAGVAALERAKSNLKRYRAAVVKAGIEGTLTKTWRAGHPQTEPASKLLERTLAERRRRWEVEQLAKYAAAEREPPKNWKEKYVEPIPLNSAGLPELPEGWCWAPLDSLARVIGGITKDQKKASQPGMREVPYLRVANVQRGWLDLTDMKTIPASSEDIAELRLVPGDVLFTEGGDRDKLGRGWVWKGEIEECIHQNHIFRGRLFSDEMQPSFLSHHGNAFGKEWFVKAGKQTTNLASINLGILRRFPIPVPPIAEQVEIVTTLEEKLSEIAAAETVVDHSLLRAARLRQSILRQAFEGKLVPQDPTNPPISEELLERVRQEKQARTKSKKKGTQSASVADAGTRTPMNEHLTALVAPYLTGQRHAIRLHSLRFDGQFRSLASPTLNFTRHYQAEASVSPVCLVGLNGSGKSNLIELLAVILCDLELSLIGYSKVPQVIKQMKGHPFHLSFSITPKRGKADGILHITRTSPPKPRVVFAIEVEGEFSEITDPATKLALLPGQIVSYSSGLNETLSIPFLRNQAYYSEQVTQEAFGKREHSDQSIQAITTIYMDYDCNAAILLANFLFRTPKQLSIFESAIRVKSLESFSISYRLKRPTGGRPVQLTKELKEILNGLKQCATRTIRLSAVQGEQFHYQVDRDCQSKLRDVFGEAGNFFNCLNKWSQLNSLSLSKRDREYYLRSEDASSMLDRPPAVSREDRIFLIDDVQLRLSSPDTVVGYTGLSDGEHQFVQVFGSLLLFDEPGTLFLLDEPETHFNPQWRRFFVDTLNKIETTKRQEIVISTHSPFVVSGCRRDGVFKFLRNGASVAIDPCSLETFGSSYEVLLAELFNLNAMISEQAVVEMKKVLEKDDADEIILDAARFGESMEKRFLFERAAEIRSEGRTK